MTSHQKICSEILSAALLSMLSCIPALAQGPEDLTVANLATTDADPAPQAEAAPDTDPPPPPPPPPPAAVSSDNWRVLVSIYGWFPGIHGTVGTRGHNAGVHESFTDVFHVLKGVIPIAVEADKGRFVMPIDFFWVKLGDDKALPLTDLGQTSINLHITQSVFTPKFGYRMLDGDHVKIDVLAGIRYWYVSQNFTVIPSGVGVSDSANWVDGIAGARFIVPIGPKAAVTVGGDAGGGGANQDYQAIGLFTYKFTPKLGLGLGWRYLDVNYRGNHQFIYDVAETGALAGLFLEFGGKPPVPPSATCSLSPTEIWAGDPVTATISTQNFNPKHTLTYNGSSNGCKGAGTGTTANVDTAGLAPGSYSVRATATDTKEKKNNVATCDASFTVRQPHPPQATCSASPDTVKSGDPSTVTVSASSPDNFPLTYAWSSSAGTISGNGASATLDTAGAPQGSPITTTSAVTDSRGLSTTCNATVNVLSAPVVVSEATEIAECNFKDDKRPGRVDNECKAVLDDLALRIQREPNGKFVIVGYAEDEETVKMTQLGAQRAVNVKYYLTEGESKRGVDPSRLEPRTGVVKSKSVKIYFVPSGATLKEESTVVDETQLQPQPRNAPAPRKKSKTAATQPPSAQ